MPFLGQQIRKESHTSTAHRPENYQEWLDLVVDIDDYPGDSTKYGCHLLRQKPGIDFFIRIRPCVYL